MRGESGFQTALHRDNLLKKFSSVAEDCKIIVPIANNLSQLYTNFRIPEDRPNRAIRSQPKTV